METVNIIIVVVIILILAVCYYYCSKPASSERFGPLETATDAVCQDQKNKRECVATNKDQIVAACNSVLASMVCSEIPSNKPEAIAACKADPVKFTCNTLGEDSYFCQDIKSICSADNLII